MEEEGVLDPDDMIHLFCLHYVYSWMINRSLWEFTNAWNRHPMETEHGLSPEQQWVVGLSQYGGQTTALTEVSKVA